MNDYLIRCGHNALNLMNSQHMLRELNSRHGKWVEVKMIITLTRSLFILFHLISNIKFLFIASLTCQEVFFFFIASLTCQEVASNQTVLRLNKS